MRGWVVVLAAAGCYGDQIEATPDAAVVDDPHELVTLQFHADAVDLAGFSVYFQNADSSLVLATRTDGDGRARARMLPGGFVTLALPGGRMYTYAGVRAGDELVVDEADNNTEHKEIQVAVPVSPGANLYTMWTSCGSSRLDADLIEMGMPQQVLLTGCGASSDVVITASSTEPQPFGSNYRYLYGKEVALDPSAVLALRGEFEPQIESAVVATELRDASPRVVFTQQLVRDRHDVTQGKSVTADVVGGAATGRIAKMFAPTQGTTLTRVTPQALGVSGQTTFVWGPSGSETAIALGDRALRAYTTRPELLATSTSVAWTEEPTGEIGDLVMLGLSWQPEGAQSRMWKLLSPRSDASVVRYPLLPLAELRPSADAWVTQLTTIAIDDDSSARTTLLGNWPGNDAWVADTDAGRADVRMLVPPFRN